MTLCSRVDPGQLAHSGVAPLPDQMRRIQLQGEYLGSWGWCISSRQDTRVLPDPPQGPTKSLEFSLPIHPLSECQCFEGAALYILYKGGHVRGRLSWSPISVQSPVNSVIISMIISLIIYIQFLIQSLIWSPANSAIISMIVSMIVSAIILLIISICSPVNSMITSMTISMINTMVQTPALPKPRILALVFRKSWPKIEGLYIHLLSNVTPLACIYVLWSHWWCILRLLSLDIPITRWDPLASCPSIDSLWIPPSSACMTSTCYLGCPNKNHLSALSVLAQLSVLHSNTSYNRYSQATSDNNWSTVIHIST